MGSRGWEPSSCADPRALAPAVAGLHQGQGHDGACVVTMDGVVVLLIWAVAINAIALIWYAVRHRHDLPD